MHLPQHTQPVLRAGLTFTINARTAAMLAADEAARELWAIAAGSNGLPAAIDGAMPAVQRLRQLAGDATELGGRREILTFWTPRGAVRLRCRLDAARGEHATFHVSALGEDSAASTANCAAAWEVAPTAWLAHELRTPLGAIIACAEVLKTAHFGPMISARYRDYAQAIFDGAHHALAVIDAILRGDPARFCAPQLAFVDLDPAEVVESCLAVARPLADRAGLALATSYAARLPHIVADELSLRQMLLNLIGNAIKFARRGDQITVGVACAGDGALTISVDDTGPGIDTTEGISPRAEEANAAHTAKATRAGMGLGLPLTKALADANGADLAIVSQPGAGTRVTISFAKGRVIPL
jgi:signal transduction histidine kinase